jgi:hypothetical protein
VFAIYLIGIEYDFEQILPSRGRYLWDDFGTAIDDPVTFRTGDDDG